MKIEPLPISGAFLVQRNEQRDGRGLFSRIYCKETLLNFGVALSPQQINLSHTKIAGTVRGLHYQIAPSGEAKYITCLTGKIFDVMVDLRQDSDHYLKVIAIHLNDTDQQSLLVPAGVAHGFQALTDDVTVLYINSDAYEPAAERGLNPIDPKLAIPWPLKIALISEKDAKWELLAE